MKIFVIPDTQVKPGLNLDHLEAAGNYIQDKKPDVIVHLGDHWDMQSLSSYDRGTAKAEGARYGRDIDAGIMGMMRLLSPIKYKPRKIFHIGNHEDRITRHVNANPELIGTLSLNNLELKSMGWEVPEYLAPVCINDVYFSHYFYNPNTGKPYSGRASTRLSNLGFSFVQGHQQGLDVAMKHLSNGRTIRGLVAGSFYRHHEDYKGPQANNHWRGCLMLHEVKKGNYGLMELSIQYLLREWL